jgi:hypothetical protein
MEWRGLLEFLRFERDGTNIWPACLEHHFWSTFPPDAGAGEYPLNVWVANDADLADLYCLPQASTQIAQELIELAGVHHPDAIAAGVRRTYWYWQGVTSEVLESEIVSYFEESVRWELILREAAGEPVSFYGYQMCGSLSTMPLHVRSIEYYRAFVVNWDAYQTHLWCPIN